MKLLILLITTLLCFQVNARDLKVLEFDENGVALRDAVTWSSMSQLQQDLLNASYNLRSSEPILLLLDTPGGSVMAGQMFEETKKVIKNPIHCVVSFAASMGFQITQVCDKRYILESGTLMSHRATISLSGQMDGELESRLLFYKSVVHSMEVKSSNRIGIDLDDYKNRIINEWWEYGNAAIKANVADEVVAVKCSEDLVKETEVRAVRSFFGSVNYVFSKCPLITAPLELAPNNDYISKELESYTNLLYNNKREFINQYVKPGLFNL